MALSILMYHGLYSNDAELLAMPSADRPYAVSTDNFFRQLNALREHNLEVVDPARLGNTELPERGVVLTFDDGHASNHRHALPMLSEAGVRAAFFVTTDFIEHRPDFCSWTQLRELANAGMTVGSHGRTHRFLDDLTSADARDELAHSRVAIEDGVGQAVTQVSFPGGRFRPADLEAWRAIGYRVFHTSRVGVHRKSAGATADLLPRLAIRRDTEISAFVRMARGDRLAMLRAQFIAGAKRGLRRASGNRIYHLLYERVHDKR